MPSGARVVARGALLIARRITADTVDAEARGALGVRAAAVSERLRTGGRASVVRWRRRVDGGDAGVAGVGLLRHGVLGGTAGEEEEREEEGGGQNGLVHGVMS